MNHIEYRIEQKHAGEWFGFQAGAHALELSKKLRELKMQHPDTEYRLIRETKKREVIG